ncbi:hypothetical protein HY449_01490 [Candidatus Pacearchaeota archaeon]|nr:hypothetical protein [Candidatus Pacearchaeota archaeon]
MATLWNHTIAPHKTSDNETGSIKIFWKKILKWTTLFPRNEIKKRTRRETGRNFPTGKAEKEEQGKNKFIFLIPPLSNLVYFIPAAITPTAIHETREDNSQVKSSREVAPSAR